MALRQRPGDIARQVGRTRGASESDILQRDVSGMGVLRARRDAAVSEVEKDHAGIEEGARRRMGVIDGWITSIETQRDERMRQRRPRVQIAAAWRDLGIQQRVPVLDVSMPVRAAIIVALAVLDFQIFAQAIAYAESIEVSLFNPAYLLAGALGLMVFACGFLLGRAIKDWIYAVEQQRLLDELTRRHGDEYDPGVVAGAPPYFLARVSGVLFFALIGVSVYIRVSRLDPDDGLGIVFLQALVPVLAMVIEIFLHDPSNVPERGTSPLLAILRWRRSRYQAELNRAQGQLNTARREVQRRYDVEIEILDRDERSRGGPTDRPDDRGGPGPGPAGAPAAGA